MNRYGLSVKEQRRPWLLTAGLMLAAAVAAAWSTYLYWLPWRGTMLEGTTWTSELLVLAIALAGLAWLTLVFCIRWQLRTKAVAALPGVATVVMALAVAAPSSEGELGEDHALLTMLPVAVEWSALFALAMIWVWQPEVRTRRRFLRVAVALWGTTAFGVYHQMLYMIMVGFSERDGDELTGTRYLTVATLTISAILTVIMTLRTPQKSADDEPGQDDHSGSLTRA